MKPSSKQTQQQSPLNLDRIKRVLLLGNWVAAGGDRGAAAEAVGVGYTNAVESLRAYGVPLRSGPTLASRDDSLGELILLGDAVQNLIRRIKKTKVSDGEG